jgi:hypothetical protein
MRLTFFILIGLLTSSSFPARAQDSLPTLEALVAQWVELRATISDEQRAAKAEEAQWQLEIDLLEREKKQLEDEISSADKAEETVQKEQADLLKKRDQRNQQLAEIRPVLDRTEADLRDWKSRIPPARLAPLEAAFLRLPENQIAADKIPVSRRLQLALALLTQIEQMQRELHLSQELVKLSETETRQVDVLYFGLARGFAVAKDNSWAGVGTPGINGWTWEPQLDQAESFRRAIKIFQREEPAALIELPLGVLEGKE